MQEHQGIDLVIADIEAIARKSYEALSAESLQHGANRCFVINMVDRGEVHFGSVLFDSVLHEVDGWTIPFTATELPKFMVVEDQRIAFWDDGGKRGPILAYSREVAERYVAEYEKRLGSKLAVADIQAVAKMTVKEVLDALVEDDRANCAMVIRSVADDGEAKADYIYPVNPTVE
jgi:hypothetical protein